jgi:DNA-binding NarL/FixJ family response regulator
MRRRNVLLVDDHAIVRQGLAQLVEGESDLTVCAEAEDAQQAIDAVESLHPDIAVVDLSLGGRDGIELIKDLKHRSPDLPVLVLSMHDESLYAERALRAGARGYIMKEESADKVLTALRRILGGEIYVSDEIQGKMLHRMFASGAKAAEPQASPLERLTDRELEIFRMIGEGLSARQVADKLFLSVKTVEAHREHIKQKLDLKSSNELLRFAIQHGLD